MRIIGTPLTVVKRNARWRIFVGLLALAVAVFTAAVLIIPAKTMEWEPDSGINQQLHRESENVYTADLKTETVKDENVQQDNAKDVSQPAESEGRASTESKSSQIVEAEPKTADSDSQTLMKDDLKKLETEAQATVENGFQPVETKVQAEEETENESQASSDNEKNTSVSIASEIQEDNEPQTAGDTEDQADTEEKYPNEAGVEVETIVNNDLQSSEMELQSEADSEDVEIDDKQSNTEEKPADSDLQQSIIIEMPISEVTKKMMMAGKASLFALSSVKAKKITAAGVSLEGGELKEGEFTFYLYDDQNTLIAETQNDADGNVTFEVPVSGQGIYYYTIAQKAGDNPNVIYDTNKYTITVAVEDNNTVSSNLQSNTYYGLNVMSSTTSLNMTYKFYMSKTLNGKDYQVLCIDHSAKPAPTTATSSVYWVAEVSPSDEMLLSCVCNETGISSGANYEPYDGWCDDLGENLKKFLYATTYGSDSNMTDLVKQTLAWHMTQGSGSVPDKNKQVINDIIESATVPDGYELVLFHPSNGAYQSFVTLLPSTKVEKIKIKPVAFVNKMKAVQKPVKINISGTKLLNGKAPGSNNIFTFELLENGRKIAEAKNDAEGNIEFSLSSTEIGSHTYCIREVNDGQTGITYDTTEYTVTVNVGNEDIYDLSGTKYYSVRGSNYAYYMSDLPNTTDFPVYCIDFDAIAPSSTTNTSVTYTKLVNPDSETLENYVTVNLYGDKLAENLRKLFYYLEVHSKEYSVYQKKNLVWAATGDDFPGYEEKLNSIYENTEVPEDYELILFIPNGYSRNSYYRNQPLMGAIGATVQSNTGSSSVVFENTKVIAGKEIPEAGGIGTTFIVVIGLILIIIAVIGYIFNRRKIKK